MDWITEIWNWILSLLGIYVSPGAGTWRGCLFIPHKIYDVGGTPVWPGNRGADSLMGAASDAVEGQPWQAAKRTNWFKWAQAYGADTWFYIAEPLFNNPPVLGYFSNENGEFIQEARKHGIKRGVVSMFNDGALMPVANREPHIKSVCEAYAWANANEIAYLVGLECDETMSVEVVRQIVGWLKQYGGGKRIIVGSANANFLKAFSADGVELWAECDEFPFDLTTIIRADVYLAKLRDLQSSGKVWAGEWGAGGAGEVDKYITAQSEKLGVDHGSGYYKE